MGGGDVGEPLQLTVQADATLKAAIDAMILAGTVVNGHFVKFSNAANYQVSLQADTENPAMIITSWRENKADGTYDLGVEVLQNIVKTLPYRTGTSFSLGNKVRVEGSDYKYVEHDAGGIGTVIGINTSAETVDVLFS
jgi:hypothetical protein